MNQKLIDELVDKYTEVLEDVYSELSDYETLKIVDKLISDRESMEKTIIQQLKVKQQKSEE